MPVLEVEDLVVRLRTRDSATYAVNGISYAVDEGETLGLVGESGCGKSISSLAVMGLLPKPAGRVEGGRIRFDGTELLTLSPAQLRRLRGAQLAMISQDPMTGLNPVLRIEEQLSETFLAHQKLSKAQARERSVEMLKLVGIPRPEENLRAYPHELSGGMRQRIMIAMALSLSPKLVIADEPTTALDATVQAQVLELLRKLTADSKTAVILITHDLGVVAGMTQRINVMYSGYVVETATTTELFDHPSHPYTIGLLHSVPRPRSGSVIVPVEGSPPDQHRPPVGCPFAPRCAWRVERCWTDNPALHPIAGDVPVIMTGPNATHRIACYNPPTPEESDAGRPLSGARPAPPPEGHASAGADRFAMAAQGVEA